MSPGVLLYNKYKYISWQRVETKCSIIEIINENKIYTFNLLEYLPLLFGYVKTRDKTKLSERGKFRSKVYLGR